MSVRYSLANTSPSRCGSSRNPPTPAQRTRARKRPRDASVLPHPERPANRVNWVSATRTPTGRQPASVRTRGTSPARSPLLIRTVGGSEPSAGSPAASRNRTVTVFIPVVAGESVT